MEEKNCIKNIDVSIIVPLFHSEKYLDNIIQMTKRNIESATDISIELVLINDSPNEVPDFSVAKNTSYQTIIVLNEENLGIQCARIQGVKHSHGKYLFFMDQDDEVADDIIIRLYKAVSGGEISVSDWEQELSGKNGIYLVTRNANTKRFTLKNFCTGGNVIGPPGHCLIRRDCLPDCWSKRIMKTNGADDVLLWMGMLAEGCKFIHCEGKLYVHKLYPECCSKDVLNMLDSEEEAFMLAAEEYGISGFWRAVHRRHIKYRRRNFELSEQGCNSKFRRRLRLLLYPEILMFHIMDKL